MDLLRRTLEGYQWIIDRTGWPGFLLLAVGFVGWVSVIFLPSRRAASGRSRPDMALLRALLVGTPIGLVVGTPYVGLLVPVFLDLPSGTVGERLQTGAMFGLVAGMLIGLWGYAFRDFRRKG